MNIKWSNEDKEFVKQNAHCMKDKDIAQALSKTLNAVRKMRQKLGIKKACGRGRCSLLRKTKL
jgi:bacterioferritin-associated ferredoxin